MKKFSSVELKRIVENDVNRIIQHAQIVISLTPERPMVFVNPKPALNVLAVIGPEKGAPLSPAANRFFPSAVLLEIGLGRGRPYHKTKNYQKLNSTGNPTAILKRRKWFHLTEQQYIQAAPWIFSALQDLTNEKVARWECNHNNPYRIASERQHFVRRSKAFISKIIYLDALRGARFSVSLEDRFLLSDVYWAEKQNKDVRLYLESLAKKIDLRLNFNNYARKPSQKPRKELSTTERFKQIAAIINEERKKRGSVKDRKDKTKVRDEKLPSRYIVDLLDYLPRRDGESRSKYYYAIAEALGYTGEELREEKFVRQVLPDPQERLNDIQLRITTGLSNRDHIVFEVVSNLSAEEIAADASVST